MNCLEEKPLLRLWHVLHILPGVRFSRRRVQEDNRQQGPSQNIGSMKPMGLITSIYTH